MSTAPTTPHRRAPEPSADDWQEAWHRMHKPDWPTLHQLRQAAAQLGMVQGMARRLAAGERAPAPAEPAAQPVASSPVPLPKHPPQLDRMRQASGERADD